MRLALTHSRERRWDSPASWSLLVGDPTRERLDGIGKLVLRLLVGGLMLFHGVDKVLQGPGEVAGDLAAHGVPPLLAYGV